MLERNGIIYFTQAELRCPRSNVVQLATGFGNALLDLRIQYNRAMRVNSCCRSKDHNASIPGASTGSYHIYDRKDIDQIDGTCAIDIHCIDSTLRARLIEIALTHDWCVGINKTFIHLDRRIDFGIVKAPLVFLY